MITVNAAKIILLGEISSSHLKIFITDRQKNRRQIARRLKVVTLFSNNQGYNLWARIQQSI
jgi:hypothetical protein